MKYDSFFKRSAKPVETDEIQQGPADPEASRFIGHRRIKACRRLETEALIIDCDSLQHLLC